MTTAFNLSQLANNLDTSGKLDATDGLYGALPVANGGTGASTLTANNLIVGNGTSAVSFIAPGTSGNLLVSNGTTWTSSAVLASGSIVKTANFQTGTTTNYSSYTAFPIDATVPLNTEGAQAMSLSYAMTNASNLLDIQAIVYMASSFSSRYLVAALFSSASSNAIASAFHYEANNGIMNLLVLRTRISPGTTTSRTYTVRIGDNGGNIVALNGDTSGVNYFGGTLLSGIYIQEIKA